MGQPCFIGLDIGTTSVKAIAFSAQGVAQSSSSRTYPLLSPQPTWAEQDPTVILAALVAAMRETVEQLDAQQEIVAIGLSTAMHSLIAIAKNGERLTPSITWADNRSLAQAQQLRESPLGEFLYQRTGTPIHPMSPLTKLMWMQEHRPDWVNQAAKFISIKEYILSQLFGQYLVDHAIASATGLFNLQQLQWDSEALAIAGIQPHQLSDLVPATQVLRGMQPEYAAAMKIDPYTPFVVGASDGALANLGVGAIAPQQTAVTIGTSGAVRTLAPTPTLDPQGRTFCYAFTPEHWVIGGATNSGGVVLQWFRDQCCQAEVLQAQQLGVSAYDLMIQAADQVTAGAEGLLFLPFLAGERAPYWNANARGCFVGLGLHHQHKHLIRAVLEGILFSVYSVHRVLNELVGPTQELRASGGFARSPIWRQMMADLFGCPVLLPAVYEGSALGAAILAMYAIGAIPTLSAHHLQIDLIEQHQPNSAATKTYQPLFQLFERVYHNIRDEVAILSSYQRLSSK